MNVKRRFSLEAQLNSVVDNISKKVFRAEKVSAVIQESLGEVVSQQLIRKSNGEEISQQCVK
jgi:hypothetical protein